VASRLGRYLGRLYRISASLALIGIILYAVQAYFHPFDPIIERIAAYVAALDEKITQEAFNGITIGTLVLVVVLCVFPIFLRRIDERAYGRGLWRGLISAAVFYLSSELFTLAQKLGRVHLVVAVIAVIVVTAVVVEGIALSVREEDEKSFRTDVVASIASGLLFGVLVRLGGYGLEYAKSLLPPSSSLTP
jgi:xanthine/uracil permease